MQRKAVKTKGRGSNRIRAALFVLLAKYCLRNEIKDDEMGGASLRNGEKRSVYKILFGEIGRTVTAWNIVADGRLILKWVISK